MQPSKQWRLLPHDHVEHQISQIDLLTAMYPAGGEVTIDNESEEHLRALRACAEEGSTTTWTRLPVVVILLTLAIGDSKDSSTQRVLQLDVNVPFSWEGDEPPNDPPRIKVRIRQPRWLNKASTAQLNSQIPQGDEDLFSTIQSIQESTTQHLEDLKSAENKQEEHGGNNSDGLLARVWFYFPSISTRSKRDDFITHAPFYQLTGFLYAGKPGLLCVEGPSQNIDDYMKFIKTESWGDIPAHHKKVSERHREKGLQARVFSDMQEITDDLGERRGHRANRGDMKAMEGWLVEKGLGDAFAKVLM